MDGGQILGEYPVDITPAGPLNLGRGRILPTTSWDAVWNGISEWMGADSDSELDDSLFVSSSWTVVSSSACPFCSSSA